MGSRSITTISIVGAIASSVQSIFFTKKHFVSAAGMNESTIEVACDTGHQTGGGSECNETSGEEQNLKDEAPRDAGFSDTKHLPVPGSQVNLCSPACWGGEEAAKVKACSDFIREGREEGRKAPHPDPATPGR